MDESSFVLLYRCEGRGRQHHEMELRGGIARRPVQAGLQARRYQAGRHDHRRWLSRKGWIPIDGCAASDAARRPRCFWSFSRRRRSRQPIGTPMRHLFVLPIVAALGLCAWSPGALAPDDDPLTVVDLKPPTPTPAPQTAGAHPHLSGYWKGPRDTIPGGNIGKALPGLKLPLTP